MILQESQKKSLLKLLHFDAIFLLIGIAFIFWRKFSYTLPCITKTLLKIYCPACGGTRAVSSLLRFDIIDSLRHNPIVIYIALCIVILNVFGAISIMRKSYGIFRPIKAMLYVGIAILTVFCIVKNVLMVFFGIDLSNELISYWRN